MKTSHTCNAFSSAEIQQCLFGLDNRTLMNARVDFEDQHSSSQLKWLLIQDGVCVFV